MNRGEVNQGPFRHRGWIALILLAVVATASAVFAQTTTPAPATPAAADSLEGLPVNRGAKVNPTTNGSAASVGRPGNMIDPYRLLGSLVIVFTLIFALRWAGKRFFPGVVGGRASGAVRVLSRSHIAPKHQVLLLQVGRRILVVADTGTQVSSLSEITDPDEVAHLVGQVNGGSREAFEAEFGKAQESFDQTEKSEMPDPEAADVQPPPESMADARGEINGLMDKVRMLAKQLGRS